MKIEMIVKREVRPPRYIPRLGWVQDGFWAIKECKKDGKIVEGIRIEAEYQTTCDLEPVYGNKKPHIIPINKLFLWVDGVLEMYTLLSHDEKLLDLEKMQLIFEVEKN